LSKKYRNLWVFGDSFTTPYVCVDPEFSFWMSTARILNVDTVYNYSWRANSFDSIVHNLSSESEQYNWQEDFFLIGVPPLVRMTVLSKDTSKSYYRRVFNIESKEIDQEQILCHHGLDNIRFANDPVSIKFEDPTWTQTQACQTIFLLNCWLDSKQANYLIVNLSKDFMFDRPANGVFLQNQCFNHDRNILHGDTYYNLNLNKNPPLDFDAYGWGGHHGPVGNQYFFNEGIVPRLKNNNLI